MEQEEDVSVHIMAEEIVLSELQTAVNDCVYVWSQPALVIDPLGGAASYFKHRNAVVLNIDIPGDFSPDNLRKRLVSSLHFGIPLVLDFSDRMDKELTDLVDEEHFPEFVLHPTELMKEENYMTLWKEEYGEGLLRDASTMRDGGPSAREVSGFCAKPDFILVILTQLEVGMQKTAPLCHVFRVVEKEKDQETSDSMLQKRLPPPPPNSTDLTDAAFDGDLSLVKELLKKGIFVDSREDMSDNTALSEAALKGHAEICRVLLDYFADPNSHGNNGRTPLYRAAFNGHLETVQLLLERGSDPDKADNRMSRPYDVGKTPEVQEIISNWDREVTRRLVGERDQEVLRKEVEMLNSIHLSDDEKEQLERLRREEWMQDEMSTAITFSDTNRIEKLLTEEGCSIEIRDKHGNTPLMLSCMQNQVKVAEFLLEKGARVNNREKKGWTSLSMAAYVGNVPLVRLLLEKGGDKSVRNVYGKTPYQLCKDKETKDAFDEHDVLIVQRRFEREAEAARFEEEKRKKAEEAAKSKKKKVRKKVSGKTKRAQKK